MKLIEIIQVSNCLADAKVGNVEGVDRKLVVGTLYRECKECIEQAQNQLKDLQSRGCSQEEISEANATLLAEDCDLSTFIDKQAYMGLIDSNDFTLSQMDLLSKFIKDEKS